MQYGLKIFITCVLLSAAGSLCAQVGSAGYSNTNEQIKTDDIKPEHQKKYDEGKKKKAAFDKKAMPMKKWDGGKAGHDFNKKMWANPNSGSGYSTDNRYETRTLQYDQMPKKWYVNNDKEAWVENLDVMREMVRASKFKNAEVYQYPVDTYDRIREHIDTMSMQDINRYNFRRNHSSEPGLPTEAVGRKNWLKQSQKTVSASAQ